MAKKVTAHQRLTSLEFKSSPTGSLRYTTYTDYKVTAK